MKQPRALYVAKIRRKENNANSGSAFENAGYLQDALFEVDEIDVPH
jgi:hypothetical protein